MPWFSTSEVSKAPKHTMHESAMGTRMSPGPYIGIVKNNIDPQKAGRLQVWIGELGGDPDDSASWRTVAYASPFYGVTPPPSNPGGKDVRPSGQSFGTNPHSYGFWMTPPDLGVKVLCTFVNGDPFKGYWFACLPDWPSMHMLPAIGGNSKNPLPLVEYNDDDSGDVASLNQFDTRMTQAHEEVVKQLRKQGLDQDKQRGLVTSSAFRESPSAVFGFSTPGRPLKEPSLSPEGEDQIVNTNVSGRKGGHSFVMDDGDKGGANQLMRLRSGTGHQIMMHDTGGFIYIINSDGTAWIELDRQGNINMWGKGKLNMKSDGPLQIESDAEVKISGKKGVSISSDAGTKISGKSSVDISSTGDTKVTGQKGLHLKGKNTYLTGDSCVQINGGGHLDLSAGCVTLNSVKATKAQPAGSASPPSGMPGKEPWSGHMKGGNSSSAANFATGFVAGVAKSSTPSGSYGKAADYSGVTSNQRTADTVQNSFIGSTGGAGRGATGFRQGTESAPVATGNTQFNGTTGTTDWRPAQNGALAVGSGQCVGLVTQYSDAGHVSTWRPASNQTLFDNPPQPGAVIATLKDGYYANRDTGNHAAIYLGQGQDARGRYILVQEQNVAKNEYGEKVIGERRIYENRPGSDSNNASTYRVVANNKYPEGVYVRNAPPATKEALAKNQNETNNPEKVEKGPAVNSPDKGYLSPEQEAANREQLKKETDAAGTEQPVLSSEATAAYNANVQQNSQALTDARKETNYAEARYNTAQTALKDNEDDFSRGKIDPAEYRARASELQKEANDAKANFEAAKNNESALASDVGMLGSTPTPVSSDPLNLPADDYKSMSLEGAPVASSMSDARAGEISYTNSQEKVIEVPVQSPMGDNFGFTEKVTIPNTSTNRDINYDAVVKEQMGYNTTVQNQAYNPDNPNFVNPEKEMGVLDQNQAMVDQNISNLNVDAQANAMGANAAAGVPDISTIGDRENNYGDLTFSPSALVSDKSTTPISGGTPPPGQGGAGTTSAPQNNMPQSQQGPAC